MASEFVSVNEEGVASVPVSPREGSVVLVPISPSDRTVASKIIKAQMYLLFPQK